MTDTEAELIQCRFREQLLAKILPKSFTVSDILRIFADVVCQYRSVGIDISPKARIIVSLLIPEVKFAMDEEDQISCLYDELASLAAEGREEEYHERLRVLRTFQEAEASRMSEYFESNCPLRSDNVESAIRKADELLVKHEKPSTKDPTSGCGH